MLSAMQRRQLLSWIRSIVAVLCGVVLGVMMVVLTRRAPRRSPEKEAAQWRVNESEGRAVDAFFAGLQNPPSVPLPHDQADAPPSQAPEEVEPTPGSSNVRELRLSDHDRVLPEVQYLADSLGFLLIGLCIPLGLCFLIGFTVVVWRRFWACRWWIRPRRWGSLSRRGRSPRRRAKARS
jgi:hypothetical protein